MDEFSILANRCIIAIVAVDEYYEMRGVDIYLRALVVRSGRSYASLSVTIYWESMNVDVAASDTLRMALLPCQYRG